MYQERMFEKLHQARRGVKIARKYFPNRLEAFLKLGIERDGIYKNIEFAIQNILDICAILVKERDLGVPADDADLFRKLERAKILSPRSVQIIRDMRGFRNLLVHQYGEVDDRIAYREISKGLADFDELFSALEKEISKRTE